MGADIEAMSTLNDLFVHDKRVKLLFFSFFSQSALGKALLGWPLLSFEEPEAGDDRVKRALHSLKLRLRIQ
jgi:hypothetical protein